MFRARRRCLLLDDAHDVAAMDQKYGVIMVLGENMMPEDGFIIGGNAAAGAADLHAGVQEQKKLDKQSLIVLHELATKVVAVR